MPDFDTLYQLSRDLSSFAWVLYTLCYVILVITMSRVAWKTHGQPFHWPVYGRWLLAFHFFSVGLVFAELTFVFFLPRWFGIHISDLSVMILSYGSLIPAIFVPWLIKRLMTVGLTDGVS